MVGMSRRSLAPEDAVKNPTNILVMKFGMELGLNVSGVQHGVNLPGQAGC